MDDKIECKINKHTYTYMQLSITSAVIPCSISNFTLNLLEDSGWYKVNYAVAESLQNYEELWGKGKLERIVAIICVKHQAAPIQ